jgi:hypothetical protein
MMVSELVPTTYINFVPRSAYFTFLKRCRETISTFICWPHSTVPVPYLAGTSKLGTETNQNSVFNPDHLIYSFDLDSKLV